MIAGMHPEDIKSVLRKRFGSIAKFERAHALPKSSVSDVLRGKPSARVADAVQTALVGYRPTASAPQAADTRSTSCEAVFAGLAGKAPREFWMSLAGLCLDQAITSLETTPEHRGALTLIKTMLGSLNG